MEDCLSVPADEILTFQPDDPDKVERIAFRKAKLPIAIVPYDPTWPSQFQAFHSRITKAIGSTALDVAHVGSTSVPGLPAKSIIDIDLIVRDISDEASYVSALEAAAFSFLFREPAWYKHRFFVSEDPTLLPCNLHVWPAHCPEVARHRIFRDWLRGHDEDRDLYAQTKLAAAEATVQAGETLLEYTKRKQDVIRQTMQKAFKELGYIP